MGNSKRVVFFKPTSVIFLKIPTNMIKIILTATFVIIAILSSLGQVGTSVTLTKKCPNCTPSVSDLIVYNYEREGFTETLTHPEQRGFIRVDWDEKTVYFAGERGKIRKITRHNCTVTPQTQEIWVEGGVKLTLFFGENSKYIGHRIETEVK